LCENSSGKGRSLDLLFYVKEVALLQTDEILKNALLEISNKLMKDYNNNTETKTYWDL
jgi:hypothetical protein